MVYIIVKHSYQNLRILFYNMRTGKFKRFYLKLLIFVIIITLFLYLFTSTPNKNNNENIVIEPKLLLNQPPKSLPLINPPSVINKNSVCGYQSCPATKAGMINVHLVPHTHDDVGWLKTVDQYYYGSKNTIWNVGVQYIINSVIDELSWDPSRRFIYVELAFFWQWWEDQNDAMKAKVINLVNNGQLEFIGGAWSMHDEAVTHYQSILDQFTWGHRKLNDTFGECGRPRIGWQIDPFGHARETASMMAQMGFDGFFIGRLDYQDRSQRLANQNLEFLWKASKNMGDASSIFSSILFYFYMAPDGFCFDKGCLNTVPIVDNVRSPDYNVDARIDQFIQYVNNQANYYRTENVIIAMGGDFSYEQADRWYKNMDKLIKYINARQKGGGKVNLIYSTPSCYLKAVNKANKSWNTKTDDFFPYGSDSSSFWTGYFTSRPTLKFMERQGNNLLQVCKQLHVLAQQEETDWSQIANLREAMGIMQHHDAITGTEKQHVADDYALRLHRAFVNSQSTIEKDLNIIMKNNDGASNIIVKACLLSNISQCDVSENYERFVATVYNPLSRVVSKYVRLPVKSATYTVTGPTGDLENVQILPIPAAVQNIPGRQSSAKYELVFKAKDLPPLGYKSYHVDNDQLKSSINTKPASQKDKFIIGKNNHLSAEFDEKSGLLKGIKVGDKIVNLEQNLWYYEGNTNGGRSSGPYIFRPEHDKPTVISKAPNITTYLGSIVDEVHQVFSPWVSQIIRAYHDEEYLELEWLVGPIPASGLVGKEVISKFSVAGWRTEGHFYTDSNGREMIERRRNYRATWSVSLSEKVAGNYYPVTTGIGMTNSADGTQLFVIPDRAQGGSSINDGELELMVHRRLLKDDGNGVDEALDEHAFDKPLVARGRHLIIIGTKDKSPTTIVKQRQISQEQMIMAPLVLLSPTKLNYKEWSNNYKTQWSGLLASLPDNIHLLTLEPWRKDEILIRLEHPLESKDDPKLSKPVSFNLENIFSELKITSAQETTLSANQWIEDFDRLQWKYEDNITPAKSIENYDSSPTFNLIPMQIRTFVAKISD